MSDTLKQARERAYREVILQAAERVFAEHGYDGAKVRMVADAAGIAVGSIYKLFDGKERLYAEVLSHRLPDILRSAAAASIGAPSAKEQLIRGTRAYLGFMMDHPHWLKTHLYSHPWGLTPQHLSDDRVDTWRAGLELQIEIVQTTVDQGAMHTKNPRRTALAMWAIHQVYLAEWLDGAMSEPKDELLDELMRVTEQYFFSEEPHSPLEEDVS